MVQDLSITHKDSDLTIKSDLVDRAIEYISQCLRQIENTLTSDSDSIPHRAKINEFQEFIRFLKKSRGKIPYERIHESTYILIEHIYCLIQELKAQGFEFVHYEGERDPLTILSQAVVCLGPSLRVSQDALAACIKIPSTFSFVWTPDRLKASLIQLGIKAGYDENDLQSICQPRNYDRWIRIALGQAPQLGKQAIIDDVLELIPPSLSFDESLASDQPTLHLHLFEKVEKGSLVLKKRPPTNGIDGFDIYNRVLSGLEGMDVDFPEIENCSISPDGMELRSNVDGFAFFENAHYHVVPALHIQHDIDYDDVDENQSVMIDGDICTGFSVQSKGHVAVSGIIEDAQINAQGSLFCRGGLAGHEKALIEVKKNVISTAISRFKINASGTVRLFGRAENAIIKARWVFLHGEKGIIDGGEIQAWYGVSASEIGSKKGVKTVVNLVDEHYSLQSELNRLNHTLKEKNEKQRRLFTAKKNLISPSKSQDITKDNLKLKQIQQASLKLAKEIKDIQNQRLSIQHELSLCENLIPSVCVRKKVYPSTVIRIHGKSKLINRMLGPTRFYWIDGKLESEPYDELNDPIENEIM